jgi:hypothetical protein
MEKMGIGALVIGLVLLALGGYGVYAFFPDVIAVLKGIIGIIGIVAGLFLVIFGALMIKE